METEIKAIGDQYCQYGPSTFFKGLRITKSESAKNKSSTKLVDNDVAEDEKKHENESISSSRSKTVIIAMGDCIPVRPWHDSPIECLAEVRMIWRDKSEQSLLLSLRLYFLPENTSKGRIGHGEDEVVAVKDLDSPKGRIVIRAEDFSSWLVEDLTWNWGLTASFYDKPSIKLLSSSNGIPVTSLLSNSKLDFSEIEKEKEKEGFLHSNVTVLSYSRYCRYRATLKRLEHIEDNQVRIMFIETLSGFVASQPNTRIMFAKETIDYPDLESHEMLCPHLAPKLIGRARGRRKKITSRVSDCSSPAPSSEFSVDSCETNDSDVFDGKHLMKNKDIQRNKQRLTRNKRKSESISSEIYTTLSTGRVSKQRLPLTPLKSSTNKRKRRANMSEDDKESSSSDDNQQDEDYDDKYVNRKLKQESGSKRPHSSKEDFMHEDGIDHKSNLSHLLPAIQIPLDSSKSSDELDFLIRLNRFMADRAYAYPKLIWGLQDVNLFTIYTRVQKLGGFDAIADNRVWKNLFEDLSEPGKCITQGMTKRKYERILLPFERHERELRENGKYAKAELTISTIPKGNISHQSNRNTSKRRRSTSPAIEIIPLKNGAMENVELTVEQINEIHNIIKPKDYENQQYYNGNSNDGVSVPVHVIVRPTPNGSSSVDAYNTSRKKYDYDKLPGSSRSFKSLTNTGAHQKPKEKENIPLMLQNHTTIMPLTRDGVPTFSQMNVVELIDSDEDVDHKSGSGSNHMKKRKLDILREGGLEVTPISRRAQAESLQMTMPHQSASRSNTQTMQPNVSLMSLTPVRAPPVIQSMNMYQSTSQVFKNPKEDVINAARNSKAYCLDLTSKKQQQQYQQSQQQHPSDMSREGRNNQLSIEEVQRNYRGSNPDLQITLVKPQSESPSSSSSSYNQKAHNGHNQKPRSAPNKKQPKNVPSQTLAGIPPLNPVIIAAANELQKLQQQNMPLFPFLNGLDITPMQQAGPSSSPKNTSSPSTSLDSSLLSYLSAFYSNPMMHGSNLLSNITPAVEFLKLYNNSSSSSSRIPSSKN